MRREVSRSPNDNAEGAASLPVPKAGCASKPLLLPNWPLDASPEQNGFDPLTSAPSLSCQFNAILKGWGVGEARD